MKAGIIRAEVRETLCALIAAELGNTIDVASGFPGEGTQAEQIYITDTRGSLEYKVFAGKIRPTDDRFTISFLCVSTLGGRSRAEAEKVVQSYAAAILNSVHDTTLNELTVGNTYVMSANAAGEVNDYSVGTPSGHVAFVDMEISVHTRTNYSGADAS